MRWLSFALAMMAAMTLAVAASAEPRPEPRWIRVTSEHFELNTTSNESAARDTLRYFEQVRGFFVQIMGEIKGRQIPVSIVAFNSPNEYEPYRLNDFAAAYYHPGLNRDYIVLSHIGDDVHQTAVHEFVHLLMRHAGYNLPPWLNEGIADLYSTLKPEGDKILVGTPVAGRVRAVQTEAWVPLETILDADMRSPYYNERSKASNLYSEGWALTHMLMLSNEYRLGFSRLVEIIAQKKNSKAALEEVYGKPLARIERDVQHYIHQKTVRAVLFPGSLNKDSGPLPVEPLASFDADLRLVDLLTGTPHDAQGGLMLAGLIAAQPTRPEPYVLLGYRTWREGHRTEAQEHFQKAFELGSREPHMLFDYARLSNPTEGMRVLNILLPLDPTRADVRMEIARLQLNAHQGKQAVETLAGVKKLEPADAPRFFRILMVAELDAGNPAEAKSAAEKLLKYSKNEAEIRDAKKVIEISERKKD